jgi:hypothetical protein
VVRGFVLAFVVGVVSCGGAADITSVGSDTTSVGSDTTTIPVDAPTTTIASSCATGETCVVGDTGPGGGIVFYVSPTVINTVDGVSAGGHYLEAAPNTWNGGESDPLAEWGCVEALVVGATNIEVGTGAENTKVIDASCTTNGFAADLAINLDFNGQSDWFLPSIDELFLMYTNLRVNGVGGFASDYWSSNAYLAGHAWSQNFSGGYQAGGFLDSMYSVRPIRAFG